MNTKVWEGQVPTVLPKSFNPALPEVYQIEATCACNYECPQCQRFAGPRQYENTYFPLELAQLMVDRGDLAGSYFVEFQLSGEPTLHPKLAELIAIVKQTGVMTGMSTNGSLLHQKAGKIAERNMAAVALLDTMTVSVDAVTDEGYALYRPVKNSKKAGTQGPSFTFTAGELLEVVDRVLSMPKHPVVDLQIIELPGWEHELEGLLEVCKERGWVDEVVVRTMPDCSLITRGEVPVSMNTERELCINPWTSVTVLSSGIVDSCCFDFHGANQYGDLNKSTLAEIWAGKAVKDMRAAHMSGNVPLLCTMCYMRSPVNVHLEFFRDWTVNKGKTVYKAAGREGK